MQFSLGGREKGRRARGRDRHHSHRAHEHERKTTRVRERERMCVCKKREVLLRVSALLSGLWLPWVRKEIWRWSVHVADRQEKERGDVNFVFLPCHLSSRVDPLTNCCYVLPFPRLTTGEFDSGSRICACKRNPFCFLQLALSFHTETGRQGHRHTGRQRMKLSPCRFVCFCV